MAGRTGRASRKGASTAGRRRGRRRAPFAFGVPVSGEYFVGRRGILDRIDILVGGAQRGAINHMLLLGPRRMGKSSILLSAADRLASEPGVVPVIVNATGMPSKRRFADLYVKAVSEAYAAKAGGKDLLGKMRRAAGYGLKGLADRTEGIEVPVAEYAKFAAKFSEPAAGEDELVEDALAYPNTLGAARGLLFVVMIDEFQDVLAWGTPFLSMMRRVIQAQKSATYIFSGSAPSVLGDMVHDPNAPFYRQLHDTRVAPLGEGEVGGFVRRRFAVVNIAPEQGAVDRIYELSGGFPDYVQRLAFASYLRCIEGDKPVVTAADIEAAYPDMLAQIGRDLEAQFNMATPMERDVLIALAHSKDRAGALARAIRAPCRRSRGRSPAWRQRIWSKNSRTTGTGSPTTSLPTGSPRGTAATCRRPCAGRLSAPCPQPAPPNPAPPGSRPRACMRPSWPMPAPGTPRTLGRRSPALRSRRPCRTRPSRPRPGRAR